MKKAHPLMFVLLSSLFLGVNTLTVILPLLWYSSPLSSTYVQSRCTLMVSGLPLACRDVVVLLVVVVVVIVGTMVLVLVVGSVENPWTGFDDSKAEAVAANARDPM